MVRASLTNKHSTNCSLSLKSIENGLWHSWSVSGVTSARNAAKVDSESEQTSDLAKVAMI